MLAIIGGSGMSRLAELEDARRQVIRTPYGETSGALTFGKLNGREVLFSEVLAAGGLRPDTSRLHWWAQWITPSVEPRRFDTQFFLAAVPPDAEPTIDEKETVDAVWLSPTEALERHQAETFRLPPPQVKTLTEMQPYTTMPALAEAAARLYACLHLGAADARPRIAIAPIPDHGIGVAINDRLRRAAA